MIVSEINAYLAEWRARPFRPGTSDCAIFGANWIVLRGGPDLARGWRGKYRSLKRGLEILNEAGFADHADLAASELPELRSWMQCRPGDIAFAEQHGFLCAGIVGGDCAHFLRIGGGLDVLTTDQTVRWFRV